MNELYDFFFQQKKVNFNGLVNFLIHPIEFKSISIQFIHFAPI